LDRTVVYVSDPGGVAVDGDFGVGDVPDELYALIPKGFDHLHEVLDAVELVAVVEDVEVGREDTVHLWQVVGRTAGVEGAHSIGYRDLVGIGRLAGLGAKGRGDEREGEDRDGDPALVHEGLLQDLGGAVKYSNGLATAYPHTVTSEYYGRFQ
jgi:hypothetical protein